MRTNSQYYDSGVEWIGEIPRGWKVRKLKYSSDLIIEKGLPSDGDIKISPEDVESFTGRVINHHSDYETQGVKFQKGDTLLNKLRVYLSKFVFCESDGFSMGEMIVLRPREYLPKFQFYLISNTNMISHFNSFSRGVKVPRPPVYEILNTFCPVVPLPEQQQIVSFLDNKTSLIDSLIEKNKLKIELLKKQLSTLVKEVSRDKNVKRERLEYVVDLDKRPIETNFNKTYNKIGMYNWGRGIFKYPDELGSELGESKFNYIKEGDLLLSGQFSWEGSVSIVEKEYSDCISSHRFHILNGHKNKILNEYLWSYFISQEGDRILNINSFGSGGRNKPLNIGRLLKEKIPVPDIETQKKIRNLVLEYNFFEKYTKKRIKLLEEYRQSLISEVVTGKRRVVE